EGSGREVVAEADGVCLPHVRGDVRKGFEVLRRVRQAHEGGAMKGLLILLLAALPAEAAVTGTVINRSNGKPQEGAVVALNKLGQGGIELIDQAKSDAQGNFTINQPVQGPHLLRTAFDGVTYNHMLPPGSPTSGITVDVYNASTKAGDAKVGKHMLL